MRAGPGRSRGVTTRAIATPSRPPASGGEGSRSNFGLEGRSSAPRVSRHTDAISSKEAILAHIGLAFGRPPGGILDSEVSRSISNPQTPALAQAWAVGSASAGDRSALESRSRRRRPGS